MIVSSRKALVLAAIAAAVGFACGAVAAAEPPRLEFTRMVAHWDAYGSPDYLPFIDEAQPEIVQLGEYGAHFWSLAHTPHGAGYPSHFPVQGLRECGDWFEKRNAELHARGCKVIGHFNVEFLVGDPDSPEGPRGFFKFYRDLWDEKELGPKPSADPLDFLERGADGKYIIQDNYSIGGMREYWACLRNPNWQKVLKAWIKRGIEHGVDGYVANYFYRRNCLCEHCQAGFRSHLAERFKPEELRAKFGIDNLATHKFTEIVSWHDPKETTPLRLEMLRYSQISNKQVFDEVFNRYGRSLKSNLIVAQWNHLGNFGQISGDERCLLPAELWGKDEDYLWYSSGDYAAASDIKNGHLGDVTLQARFIRGAFDDKPYTIGKYESTRTRMAIAEMAANGGAPMGFYTRFTDPEARQEIVRYYQFIKRHDAIYRANRSHAEVVLLYPRSKVHQGDVAAVETFKQLGRTLLDAHVLVDVLPDDIATAERLAPYRQVIRVGDAIEIPAGLVAGLSRCEAPGTVRVSVSRPATGKSLALHVVNYNREEPPRAAGAPPSAGGGIKDEKPIAVSGIRANIVVPDGAKVRSVNALIPENTNPQPIEFTQSDGRLTFALPEFLVYCVAQIELE